jgi:hypothetical protein
MADGDVYFLKIPRTKRDKNGRFFAQMTTIFAE